MKLKYKILTLASMAWLLVSCINDLNTVPIDLDVETSETVYGSAESYLQGLAKVSGAFVLQGQDGGNWGEIEGVDGGLSTFTRGYWNCQELPCDHALIAWKDDNTNYQLNFMTWNSTENGNIKATYYRVMFTITLANEYLKQTSDEKLNIRGTSSELREAIAGYRLQARALRALMWSYGLDLFGNLPFVTEADPIGMYFPVQISRVELFEYIERELLDIEPYLVEPKAAPFGMVDKGLVWGLLSRLYLNAEVYTGVAMYAQSAEWAAKLIGSGVYDLAPNYEELFMANNNNTNPSVYQEMIYTGISDAMKAQNYGGATYMVCSSRAPDDPSNPGSGSATENWAGNRAQPELVALFENGENIGEDGYVASPDSRCMIYAGTDEDNNLRNFENENPWRFLDGYSVYKWKSVASDFLPVTGTFSSTDWVFMRLGEIYLNYAEAAVRGGGDRTLALGYINELRERAYGDQSGAIDDSELTLDFLIDERGRELYWEGFRRTDLIRFGLFAGSDYLWSWKGGVEDGTAVLDRYVLFPIPPSDIAANPNLIQNNGY